MLYYVVEDFISIDKNVINLYDGNVKKLSDDIGFFFVGSNIKINVKYVLELIGVGYSLINSVNLGVYNVGVVNVKFKIKDYEIGEDKDIDGVGGVG